MISIGLAYSIDFDDYILVMLYYLSLKIPCLHRLSQKISDIAICTKIDKWISTNFSAFHKTSSISKQRKFLSKYTLPKIKFLISEIVQCTQLSACKHHIYHFKMHFVVHFKHFSSSKSLYMYIVKDDKWPGRVLMKMEGESDVISIGSMRPWVKSTWFTTDNFT